MRKFFVYFDCEGKQHILRIMVDRLRAGGVVFVGHAESLQEHHLPLTRIGRSVYEKAG